jgi:hypothetical protein
VSEDVLSRASSHSETRRFSSTGFKKKLEEFNRVRHYKSKEHNQKHQGASRKLHCNCSHADSIIPTRKESHSLRWAIFAIRSCIWLSREENCFIRPKDFPACSVAVFT